MDPKIAEAIQQVVQDAGQSGALGRKLIAWFNAVASGNEDINDRQSANRHLELLYDEVHLGDDPPSADDDPSSHSPAYGEGAD